MEHGEHGALRRIVARASLLAAPALLSPACAVSIPDPVSCDPRVGGGDSPWVPAGYSQVFGDEFDEPAFDTSKWWTRYVTNGGMLNTLSPNKERELYGEQDNHVMTGSSIKLMAYKVSNDDPAGYDYRSGMIRSKTIMEYGYFEARLRVPGGQGVWPAFWLFPENGGEPLVVVFSFIDNGVTDLGNAMHTEAHVDTAGVQGGAFLYADASFDENVTSWTAPWGFPDCFHVLGLLWDGSSVTTYVDGKMVVKRAYRWVNQDGTSAGPAHVLLNLAIGGHSDTFIADASGIDDSRFPQGLEVDYLRVYQQTKNTTTSTIGQDLCPTDGGC